MFVFFGQPFVLLSSAGSLSADQHSDSTADLPTTPLTLSLSPTISPEEFERLWLQCHSLLSEQGDERKKEFWMLKLGHQ